MARLSPVIQAWPHHGRERITMDAVYEARRRVCNLHGAAATPTGTNQARENARGYVLMDVDCAERLHLLIQAVNLYRGPLADGRRDWLTTARYQQLLHTAHEHLHIAERAAHSSLATALGHIKRAAGLAPGDEHTPTEAIHLYQQLGRHDLARALARRPAA